MHGDAPNDSTCPSVISGSLRRYGACLHRQFVLATQARAACYGGPLVSRLMRERGGGPHQPLDAVNDKTRRIFTAGSASCVFRNRSLSTIVNLYLLLKYVNMKCVRCRLLHKFTIINFFMQPRTPHHRDISTTKAVPRGATATASLSCGTFLTDKIQEGQSVRERRSRSNA